MTDSTVLLADLQEQVRALEADLTSQLEAHPEVAGSLREEHRVQKTGRRTGAEWPEWRDAQLTQIAVAWVLGTVFLRWTEDNGLVDPVLSGPDDRVATARELQQEHYRRRPHDTDADWLRAQFEVLRTSDAGRLLFDSRHNPLYLLPISHDAARALIAFWRDTTADGTLRHDFTDPAWDTRFLGDLYQDLSEDAKKRYALLQTPRFVESFILDRTLTPALEEFGREGLRLIDPACGSGHFLLGAFERLVRLWRDETTLDDWEVAQRALDSVHGVDANPFAVSIARFRLTVAAWKAAGVTTLARTEEQRWRPIVGCGDSLLPLERQGSFASVDEQVGRAAPWEDVHEFADHRLLRSGTYHVAVGNPPYITVKDPIQNEEYRALWSACHRQFQLTVPFAQRFFDLATRAGGDGTGAGYTGQITSNAFMKREFGTKLVEDFLPSVSLDYVVDTSGAYIPGHGTPTVVLIGRRSAPSRRDAVRAVLGVRGEPEQPNDPEKGVVWTAIVEQVEHPGSDSDWVSVLDLPRSRLAQHPWSLTGGGAPDLMQQIDKSSHRSLATLGAEPGTGAVTRADGAYILGRSAMTRARIPESKQREIIDGESVRDWSFVGEVEAYWPYSVRSLEAEPDEAGIRTLWPQRRELTERVAFGKSQLDHGKSWYEYSMFFRARFRIPLTIAFAFVATHAHFVLDRDRRVFGRTAPVIKLPEGASEDDHLALLGVLNSSTACFWLKQVSHNKGSTVDTRGARQTTVAWENFYEFTGTKIEQFPLPSQLPLAAGRRLNGLARELSAATPEALASKAAPTADRLTESGERWERTRRRMIAEQEELDWDVYQRYGLLSEAEAGGVVVADPTATPELELGQRAFEIVLARQVAAGTTSTQWFARHGSTPITELPGHWPAWYRDVVEARIAMIEKRRDIALIERPECKRRWAIEPWDKQQERALRTWLLDRLEARPLWHAHDDAGQEQPQPQTVRTLADRLHGDEEFESVARLWARDALAGREVEPVDIVAELVDTEHVPFLAAYRYKGKGHEKRAQWEHTWDLQRQEDAVAAEMGYDDPTLDPVVRREVARQVGDVPIPPKYTGTDFLRGSYWTHRGKLDVPKERFVSYPAAARDGDGSLLLGWAGWDHRERAHTLAVMIGARRGEDGWGADAVTPLLAGLAEAMPWVHQWHAAVDEAYGQSPAEIYQGFLDQQLGELGLTVADLAAWRPDGRVDVSPLPRRRRATTSGSGASAGPAAPRASRTAPPSEEQADAVLQAAATGPLANEDIRTVTGLDTAGARRLALALVDDGRLTVSGQRRGTRYHLASASTAESG